jgi:exonuclease VII large subunit
VLARGYAIAAHDGVAVRDADEVDVGDTLQVRVHRGELEAKVTRKWPASS